MKLFKILMLFVVGALLASAASGQANAFINVLTQNSGQVNLGGTVFIQVDVGATTGSGGEPGPIPVHKVRAQISVPSAICMILPNAQQTGLPAGWTITSNLGTAITVCNNTDVIPVGEVRKILIAVQGTAIGGPSTVGGNLLFSGATCTSPGSLPGDNTADNVSSSSIQVIAASTCNLTGVTALAPAIPCNGGTTTLTATPAGASGAAVEYSINGGAFQASNTFIVAAGTYTATAREVSAHACTAIATAVTIAEPAVVPAPTISITQPTCTVATGIITVTSTTTGFKFKLDGGVYAAYPAGGYILAAGAHTLTQQNTSACTSPVINVIVNAPPVTPAAPAVGTITQPTCAVSSGSVVLSGLPSGNWTINPGAITGNTAATTVTGLAAGTYNFTVTNAAGCTSAASPNVVINNVPGAPPAPTVSVTQPGCTFATGIITVTSATAGFKFKLDGGVYATYPAGGFIVAAGTHTLTQQNASACISPITNITVNTQPATPPPPIVNVVQPSCTSASGTITVTSATTGLTFKLDAGTFVAYPAAGFPATSGTHTLTAQNANGCISAVTNININAQPVAPTVSASAGTINCFGGTATLTGTASGGAAPFQYSLSGGDFQPGNTFTTGAGTYTITVRDANLCTATSVPVTITQPAAISASATAGAFACNSGTTILTVAATGGTGTLQYSINGGSFQSENTFSVVAGTYIVTIRDANLCTITAAPVTISQPVTLTASATAKRITQCGGTTLVTVTASGGIAPYHSGVGTFTRGPGIWTFTITDAGGCTATTEIDIEAPGCMDLKVYPNPAKNSVNIYHSTAEPGSSMRVYDINGALMVSKLVPQNAFQTILDVGKLAAGSYILVYLNGKEKKQILFEKVTSN
jgi:Secretion system C-terminal sorting domain